MQQPAAAKPANLNLSWGCMPWPLRWRFRKQADADSYEKAAPHVQALLASAEPRFQGLGHLFQGAIELEQSGLIRAAAQASGKNETAKPGSPSSAPLP